MNEKIFDNHIYLDTNILSHICKNKGLVAPLNQFLVDNNLSIALTGAQLSELSDVPNILSKLLEFLPLIPSVLLMDSDEIIKNEIESYPNENKKNIPFCVLINILLSENQYKRFLPRIFSGDLNKAREIQRSTSYKMRDRLTTLKNNFPPSENGKYKKSQSAAFEIALVLQLLKSYCDIRRFKVDDFTKNYKVFKSLRLYSLVIFYKYYLNGQAPKKPSDFGDLFHLFFLPYCKMIITERNMCSIFKQIQKSEDILQNIKSIIFLFLMIFLSSYIETT
jgi:hypothetical protein